MKILSPFATLCFLLVFQTVQISAQRPQTTSVFFETDRAELSAEARQTLDAILPTLRDAPDYQVNIEAFTDERGTQEYNLQLAADRATAVQNYLAAQGLMADKTAVQHWGERKALGTTELGRQKSRRVDVAVNALSFSDISALRKRISANTQQTLSIQLDQEQTLRAAGGTRLIVPAHAFVFDDGTSPQTAVELRIQEAYDPSDFILHNLTTTSGGQILQTGGMVCIEATSGGRALQLADGMSLTVSLPTGGKFDPEMELFYAQNTTNGVDWVPAGQNFQPTARIGRARLVIDAALSNRIATLKVPEYPKPILPKYKDRMTPEPKMPTMPIKPRMPQKPVWETVQKSFVGGGDATRMSRKQRKKAQEYFLEQTKRYTRDSINYVQLEQRYERNLANAEKAKANFAALHQAWEDELFARLTAIAHYQKEMRMYFYRHALVSALKATTKPVQKYDIYSDLYEAVRKSAKYRAEWLKEAGQTVEAIKIAQEANRVYESLIGIDIIDRYPGYDTLYFRAQASVSSEDEEKAKGDMLSSTGLKPISDSLQLLLREKRMNLISSKSLEELNGVADGYFAEVTRLGWINCDRFYKNPAPRLELVVVEKEEAALYAVCQDIKSMLPLYRNDDGTYSALNLPKGQRVTIVAIKLKDGMPQYATHQLRVGDVVPTMAYRAMPLREMKEELKKLNG